MNPLGTGSSISRERGGAERKGEFRIVKSEKRGRKNFGEPKGVPTDDSTHHAKGLLEKQKRLSEIVAYVTQEVF